MNVVIEAQVDNEQIKTSDGTSESYSLVFSGSISLSFASIDDPGSGFEPTT